MMMIMLLDHFGNKSNEEFNNEFANEKIVF